MTETEARIENFKTVINNEALEKLLEEQAKGTEKSQENKRRWTKYRDDYASLKAQLETLSDRVSYNVMVPFGRFAFIPGKLKHTNEVMVLLGDNWFAERSAKQAAEIVDRRLKQCNEMLEKLEKEEELYKSWKKQTEAVQSELTSNKGMEIVEPFREDEEQVWKAKHRDKVREYHQKLAEGRNSDNQMPEQIDEEDLWRRLDELELQEELEHQADLEDEDRSESSTISEESESESSDVEESSSRERKRVTWSESDSVRQFHKDEAIETRENHANAINRITFQHTRTSQRVSNSSQDGFHVRSPSDIYTAFNVNQDDTPEPKSILRVKKSTTPTRESPTQEVAEPEGKKMAFSTTSPISEEIKEREPLNTAPAPEEAPSQAAHRPVSRFKAARQARTMVP